MKRILLLVWLSLSNLVWLAAGQTTLPPAALQREFKTLPIKAGEKLSYEVKFTRFPLSAKVGEVTFEYLGESDAPAVPLPAELTTEFSPAPDERFLHFRASAVSKGILLAIIGTDVNNRYATLADRQDFAARLHTRALKEGKKQQVTSAVFDRARQEVAYQWKDLAKPAALLKKKVLPRADGTLDLLSAFYFVRLQKLKEGELLRFPVSDEAENYSFNIAVGKKEKLKTDCGQVSTIRIEPKLFGKDQIFGREGTLTMWLTDNKQHVPVKLIAKTGGNTISARLLNFKANCAIAEPGKEELETKP